MDGTETLTMVTVKNIVTPPTSPKKVVSLLHSDISLSTSSLACDISPPPPPPPPPPLPGWGPPPPPPPPPLPGWGPPPPPPPPPLPGWGPPPAPPLPGGIPPPPPPFPGGGPVPYAFSRASEHRRSKLKNFNWEAIPEERVRGKKNVWTVASFQHEIDMSRMEELFGRKEEQQLKRRSSSRKSFHAKGPINTEQASLLDDKKSMNVGIFLKQFKKPVHTIVDDIRKGDVTSYGAEKLAELCKLLPERDEEVKIFKSYKGDRTRLSEPDQFMVLLLDIPSCMQRLQMLILKEEFSPQLVALKTSIHVMRSACEELLTCIELHTIIRLVLKAGNYMNSGSYAGNAAGFRMASLLRLADTKANKPGMTLMHFVAMEAEKTDSNLCEFHNKLVHTVSASRIVKQEVEAEFQKVSKKVVAMKTTLNDEADLTQQMEPFLQEAELQIQEVQISMEKLARSVHTLIEFFCEDEEVFKLEECCSVFRTFCEKFSKALKENREWEKAELKKQEQERKRRSIATCSHKEKDMENVELEFLLLQNYKDGWRNRSLRKTPSTSPVLQSKGQQRHTGRTANSQPVTRRGMLSGQQNTEQGQVRVVEKNQDNLNRGTALGQQIRDDGQMQEKRGLQMAENQTTGTQSSKLRERFAMFEKSNTCSKMGRRHTLPVIPFTRSESSEEDSSSKKRPMLSHAGRFFSMDGSPDALSSNADQESPLQQTPRRKSPTVAECMMANGGKTSASNTTPALEPKMTLPEKASSNPDGLNIQEASLHDTSPRQRFTNFLQKMASPRAPDNLSRITDGSETKGSPKPALENSPFVNFFKRQKKLWQKEPYPPQHGQKNELDNEGLTTKVGEEGS